MKLLLETKSNTLSSLSQTLLLTSIYLGMNRKLLSTVDLPTLFKLQKQSADNGLC